MNLADIIRKLEKASEIGLGKELSPKEVNEWLDALYDARQVIIEDGAKVLAQNISKGE